MGIRIVSYLLKFGLIYKNEYGKKYKKFR